MDLKSILSPSDDNARPSSGSSTPAVPSPTSTPLKLLERSQSGPAVPSSSSSSSRAKHASPLSQAPLSNLPSHVMSPLQNPTSSPLISPVPVTPGTPHALRSHSSQSMETLADLASMQSHQPSRPNHLKASSLESIRSLDSAARVSAAQVSLTSNPRASFDINMMETPKQVRRTDFSHTSLPPDQQERLSELAAYLNERPSAYDTHIAYINMLHQAFVAHVFPTAPDGSILPRQSPATFELLEELRFARHAMHKLFAPGESIWLDWLQDESILAHTTEQRIDVIEKFRTAVEEEASSCYLWLAYGDWILECHRWANTLDDPNALDDEDRLVGKEVFSWQMVQEVWQAAVDSTKLDLAASHLVWNKYIDLKISEFKTDKSKDTATAILHLFEQRLRVPHLDSASTKSVLANWLSAHFSQDQYFDVMQDTGRIMKDALRALEDRLSYEQKLEDARASDDRDAEYNAFAQYIEWEKMLITRHNVNFNWCDALYCRAELRFPSDAALWEDHVIFVLETSRSALDLLSRATKHCPWSGSLWTQYLLSSDRSGQSYELTEGIKHRATSTGVLEAAGVEEVLKVHAAWCSYLRRRAFRPDHDEDDADIAEIGIRASIESLSSLGAKLGIGDNPDPTFRLQRIYINFLSESNRWDNARREFDNAVCDYGKSWRFWMRFYNWEMKRWRRFTTNDPDEEPLVTTSLPHLATAVLKMALDQPGLDYPEPIIEALISHCEDYESADELQSALLKIKKTEKVLAARRQIEALQGAEGAAAQQAQAAPAQDLSNRPQLSKRKRELTDSEETLHENFKRSRTADDALKTVEQTQSEYPKRDRENATVLIENLPEHVSESRVRQYFSNCGTVKALKMLENGTSALVEFDDDEAAHYALSRDGQQFDASIITVVLDTGSTVFLTNYAPETGESDIRNLLGKYGEIISVRFPSLQGNKKRRFCYVQFKLPGEAQDAVNDLDNKEINGFSLTCKISNPAIKKTRQQTTNVNDGRTVFVSQLNFKASEEEVKNAFDGYGKIELIRMPRHETMKNRNKGIAFVTFSTAEEASAALAANGMSIKDREIKVATATNQHPARQASSVPPQTNGKGQHSASPSETLVVSEPRSERTIFLTNVPDTVNEARLRQIASKSGEVVKVVLKTNHQGALIEFATVAQAGEAALAMDGHEIATNRNLRVVSEEEMKAQKPEKKVEGFAAKPKPKVAAPVTASGIIKRPTQPGNKARKGGNLGHRSALLHGTGASNDAMREPETGSNGTATTEKKSNADFRAMMSGKTEE